MKLTKQDVEHIAALARLGMTDAEKDKAREQLSNILENMDILGETDTRDVPPTSHSIEVHTVLREDIVGESMTPEETLANAPRREDQSFRILPVFE